ncbi:Glycosyl transferase family 2 [Roseivivax halotolerans]|uniref:Glycosyl transferase family 2 n=1 Tax=Roseivivax halotolerans TaxID=93684 RepID=A0A1I5Z6K1_9RHOB|nr:glycosyltransferase family 2 protein [Roseivivax halotolerans]SFQ52096.1 Glycosyl transferase family 2 [Roseivivax halotolerans]
MRIVVHIGPEAQSADRVQRILDQKREQLAGKGVLYARSPGARNHTRLFMAVSDPEQVDTLRFNRGFTLPEKQAALREEVFAALAAEVTRVQPELLILSCHQLGSTLARPSEIARLQAMLAPLSSDMNILAQVDAPARMLSRAYAAQVIEGRARPLSDDLALLGSDSWWDAALSARPSPQPEAGVFADVQGAPFWLDLARLVSEWDAVFGAGATRLWGLDPALWEDDAPDGLRDAFGMEPTFGKAEPASMPEPPPEAWLTRARRFNDVVLRLLQKPDTILARPLWRKLVMELKVAGAPFDPGSLDAVSARFADDMARLAEAHPLIRGPALDPPRPTEAWQEADPGYGFRATQYLMAARWRIEKAAKEEREAKAPEIAALNAGLPTAPPAAPSPSEAGLSRKAAEILPPLAKQKFAQLKGSPFAPHNRLGAVNEEELAAAFEPAPRRSLPEGSSGRVIVGCMKNEAPYILEWVAYHRAIGVDNFLIYTNGCEDGTGEILARLDELGIVQHRNNDNWKGNSPQQHALNKAMTEPVVTQSDWIIHIDVDEFINVRCGNGTLDAFFERVPDATNIAMTWRLFGHSGVTRLEDRFVIEQFDECAPRYCPKPHTVWGYKTMFRNIGAYKKLSCHRPNKLVEGAETQVRWVNGSGQDMTSEAIKNGWRSSKKSIGYDLLQLNHYALRSAESFLIKRQRGRALHVDRSIGLNYWIRMDWSGARDITIKRNVPRLRAEYDALLADPQLRALHEAGLDWHRAKATELHGIPEFEELYQKALTLRLTELERVAYALALDLES